jgi:hypothetical protein
LPDGFVQISVFNPVISSSGITISSGLVSAHPQMVFSRDIGVGRHDLTKKILISGQTLVIVSHPIPSALKLINLFLSDWIILVCNTFVKSPYLFYFLFSEPHTLHIFIADSRVQSARYYVASIRD